MKNVKSWIDELDRVATERQLSRYDQLLLDAAEVQLLLGNLGAADSLINKINDYNIVGTFNVLKEYEIGKEGIIESYYDFGDPIIDVQRVEQKLSEYKQHREEIRK